VPIRSARGTVAFVSPDLRVFDGLPALALLIGGDGVIAAVNARFTAASGQPSEAVRGGPVASLFVDGADAAEVERALAALRGGAEEARFVATLAGTHAAFVAAPAGALAPDASADAVLLVGVPLPAGSPPERPRPALLEDTRIFAALIENSTDFIGIADPDGRPVYLNPAGRRMIGFAPDFDFSATQIPEYYPEDQRPLVHETIIPEVMTRGRWKGETWFRHWATGARIPVSDEHFVITAASGEPLGLGTITRDITDLRDAREAALAANRAQAEFLGNVSHELRTPLTLILGPVEAMMAEPGCDANTRARLQLVHRNALRLLRLVNDLLDFSKGEAGLLEARFVPVDLARLTAETASGFASAFEQVGVRYEVDCPDAAEPAWVDPAKWEKVVLNLVSNAFKYTPEGRVRVALRLDPDAFRLTVTDTGIGIPEDEMPRVFERFHRVPGQAGRSHEGTGIGLALARELARLHGGEITLTSAAGLGSTFVVTLPRGCDHLPKAAVDTTATATGLPTRGAVPYVAEAARWVGADAEPEVDGTATGRETVLIVDDNADMRAFYRDVLSPHFRIVEAANGAEALVRLGDALPALVLSDVMMPDVDGLALLRTLRAAARTRTLPVILVSARAGAEASITGLDAGADDYLTKPFTAAELLARVRTHVLMARARQALMDELERTNRDLEQFAYVASHDLQEPLRMVASYTQLLARRYKGRLDADADVFIGYAVQGATRMQALISGLLTFSRTGRTSGEPRSVSLDALLDRALENLRLRLEERGVQLERDPLPEVVVIPDLITQVFQNLIANACKFCDVETPRIRISAAVEGDMYRISIADNGIGIEPEYAERIFAIFQRVHPREKYEGSGIGLALCKKVVESHGGRIWVESPGSGGGSTFFFIGYPWVKTDGAERAG
jgi:PAS domain S-box-containing protein